MPRFRPPPRTLSTHQLRCGGDQAAAEADPEKILAVDEAARRLKTDDPGRTTFSARSLLGAVLLGQKRLADAEPLLLTGYRGMKEREAGIPQEWRVLRIREAIERLVQLYEVTGNATEAAEWRGKLEAARTLGAPVEGNQRAFEPGPMMLERSAWSEASAEDPPAERGQARAKSSAARTPLAVTP